jgi:hypothetical protein
VLVSDDFESATSRLLRRGGTPRTLADYANVLDDHEVVIIPSDVCSARGLLGLCVRPLGHLGPHQFESLRGLLVPSANG